MLSPADDPPSPPRPVVPLRHAGFWRRAIAAAIDALLAIGLSSLLTIIVARFRHMRIDLEQIYGIGLSIGFPLTWLYHATFESAHHQATPGKLALAIKVTDLSGARIGFGRATGRFFGKFVLFSLLSFPVILPYTPFTNAFPQFLFIILMLSSVWSPALPQLLAIVFSPGFILAAFTRNKQGLHDMMTNCFVLRRDPPVKPPPANHESNESNESNE